MDSTGIDSLAFQDTVYIVDHVAVAAKIITGIFRPGIIPQVIRYPPVVIAPSVTGCAEYITIPVISPRFISLLAIPHSMDQCII
jgi:hypothetical protein